MPGQKVPRDRITLACNELPIRLSLRSGSISASTRSRIEMSRFQRSTSSRIVVLVELGGIRKHRDVNRLLSFTGKKLPHFVRREREDWREQPSQAVRHQIHCRLRRSALRRPRRKCIETVF